jgi:tetratricopeptide (TPR) repeat protein
MLDDGWNEMHFANWPKAREILEAVEAKADNRQVKAEAMFALSNLWRQRQPGSDIVKSKALLEQIVGDYKDTSVAPWAMLTLARMADLPEYEKDRNVKEATRLYEEIVQRFPTLPVADEATLRLAFTYIEKIDDEASQAKGSEIMEKWLAARPDNYLAAAMQTMLGDRYQRRGDQTQHKDDYARAMACWAAADKAGIPGLDDRATLYYKMGNVAEHKLKDYPLAVKWYEKLVYEVQRDRRFYVSKLAAERLRKEAGMPPRLDTPEILRVPDVSATPTAKAAATSAAAPAGKAAGTSATEGRP